MIDIVPNLTQTHKYIKDEKTKIAHILEKYKGNILGLDFTDLIEIDHILT